MSDVRFEDYVNNVSIVDIIRRQSLRIISTLNLHCTVHDLQSMFIFLLSDRHKSTNNNNNNNNNNMMMSKSKSINSLHQRLLLKKLAASLVIAVAVAVSSASMFGGSTTSTQSLQCSVSALILPQQTPQRINKHAFQQKNYNFIGATTSSSSMIQPKRRSSRQSSTAILLGPGNNNNAPNGGGGGGGGATDMDPGLKLLICILVDFIGVASFAAPGLGETTDVGWAPISALLVNYLFGNGIFTALAFVEEISPGLDFIPTATIAWFFENNANNSKESSSSSSVGGGGGADVPPPQSPPPRRNNKPRDSDVIDVDIID